MLSGPIFRMQVPKYVEAAIVVPGSMFGVMLQSLIMLPTFLPLLLPGPMDLGYLVAVTLPVNVVGSIRLSQWLRDPQNLQILMCHKVVPYIGLIHLVLASIFSTHPDAVAAVTFYVCAWFYSQLVNQSLKNTFWRRRPTATLSEPRMASRGPSAVLERLRRPRARWPPWRSSAWCNSCRTSRRRLSPLRPG